MGTHPSLCIQTLVIGASSREHEDGVFAQGQQLLESPQQEGVVLLVGKSKKSNVIPVLKDLLNDPDVYGHALDALTNFSGQDIEEIMKSFQTCKIAWIRNTATKYLRKKGLTS
jgi:hypothetical protein